MKGSVTNKSQIDGINVVAHDAIIDKGGQKEQHHFKQYLHFFHLVSSFIYLTPVETQVTGYIELDSLLPASFFVLLMYHSQISAAKVMITVIIDQSDIFFPN